MFYGAEKFEGNINTKNIKDEPCNSNSFEMQAKKEVHSRNVKRPVGIFINLNDAIEIQKNRITNVYSQHNIEHVFLTGA